MKTPTLIVRLVGLYLLVSCSINLVQIHRAQSLLGSNGFGPQQESIVSDMQLYSIFGLIVGAAATWLAGPAARLLTFDSAPNEMDLSERLLQPEKEEA